MTCFEQVQPVLPVQDVGAAIGFYVDRLGFSLAFRDSEDDPRYAGVRRDGVELHLVRWPVARVVHAGASDSAVRRWADGEERDESAARVGCEPWRTA